MQNNNTTNEEEFIKHIKKVSKPRNYNITNSIGVYDAYKWIRKNKWLDINYILTEHEFYSIIRTVNKYLIEEFIKGNDIVFPHRMGKLELRKIDSFIHIEDNKIKTNLPVDWKETLKLWYEDIDSFKNKRLIRLREKELFKIHYNKQRAIYNNKTFYSFNANRTFKKKVKEQIKQGQLDAFKL